MRTRIVLIVVALVLGGMAAVLAGRYLSSAATRIEAETEPVTVLVAAEDIPKGMPIEELVSMELLIEQEIPAQFVSSDAVSSERLLEGQILAVPLAEGEQVTRARFQFPAQAGLTYTIPEDHLAVTIPSDEIKGVAGFIKPGDLISVIVTIVEPEEDGGTRPGAEATKPITRIVLSQVKVLAVEASVSSTDEPEEDPGSAGIGSSSRSSSEDAVKAASSITLALLPTDVERLVYAEEHGSVWLALIGADTAAPSTDGITATELFAGE